MFLGSKPYFESRSIGFPLSPNESFTPKTLNGIGLFSLMILDILSPSPPKVLCSSHDIAQPVFEILFSIWDYLRVALG